MPKNITKLLLKKNNYLIWLVQQQNGLISLLDVRNFFLQICKLSYISELKVCVFIKLFFYQKLKKHMLLCRYITQ